MDDARGTFIIAAKCNLLVHPMDFDIYLSDEDSDTPEPKRRRYNEDESQPGKLLQSYPTSAHFNNRLSNQPDKQWCCGRFIIKTWFRL